MRRPVLSRGGALALVGALALTPLTALAPLASAAPAQAAPAERAGGSEPIAIAVADNGLSYVGFASGEKLARVNRDGKKLQALDLDRSGPVTGLDVTGRGKVWVDYGDRVSLLSPRGKRLRSWAHDPAVACSPTEHDPARYGDLEAVGPRVYVADRCRDTLSAYRRDGTLLATVDLPGAHPASGVAWTRAQDGNPARLLVTLPDLARLLVYDADRLRDGAEPLRELELPAPKNGVEPEPSAVVADTFGQVVVADAANHALFFYDGDNDLSRYRTRGYPGDPGSALGHLDGPLALDQHAQDGSGLAGNLFVADSGNGRVQRFDPGEYTFWATRVPDPGPRTPVDPTAPCDGDVAVLIEDGADHTRTPRALVRVVAPSDAESLTIGNREDLSDGQPVELAEDCGYAWRLAGHGRVHVRVEGGVSDGLVLTDRIVLDTRRPTVRAQARWVRSAGKWRMRVTAADRGGSGLDLLQHGKARGSKSVTTRWKKEVWTKDRRRIRWVRVLDAAGNRSPWVKVKQKG